MARDDATAEAVDPPAPKDAPDAAEQVAAPACHRRHVVVAARLRELIRAINDGDEEMVEAAVLDFSRRSRGWRPWLSPSARSSCSSKASNCCSRTGDSR